MGNTAKQCRLGLLQDSDFAGDLEDSKSTSGGTSCVYGSHTFCSNKVGCARNKLLFLTVQQNLKLSLDTGLRLDGLPALELWDLIVSFFGNISHFQIERRNLCMVKTNLSIKSM